jgi:hypothetical protein
MLFSVVDHNVLNILNNVNMSDYRRVWYPGALISLQSICCNGETMPY